MTDSAIDTWYAFQRSEGSHCKGDLIMEVENGTPDTRTFSMLPSGKEDRPLTLGNRKVFQAQGRPWLRGMHQALCQWPRWRIVRLQ